MRKPHTSAMPLTTVENALIFSIACSQISVTSSTLFIEGSAEPTREMTRRALPECLVECGSAACAACIAVSMGSYMEV